MGDNTFTPGPWKVVKREDEDHGTLVVHEAETHDFLICQTNQHWGRPFTNGANARLIAAAPDMYNALWEAVELSDRTLPPSGRTAECQRVYDLCRAALAKAESE